MALLLLPLGSAAWGQNQKMTHEEDAAGRFRVIPPTAPALHGIKVLESGFDPETKTLKLVFLNDRAADITAYHYCYMIQSANPRVAGEQCQLVDALDAVLTMRVEKWPPGTKLLGPAASFIHPGEKREIEEQIGWNDSIYGGSIYVDEVAWSDSAVEGPGQFIVAERTAELKEREFVSNTVKDALAGGLEPMLMASIITTLKETLQQERQHGYEKDHCDACAGERLTVLVDAIYSLEHPGRYSGRSDDKFVPANQSEFLNQFLIRHQSFSEETSKHVSLRKVDAQ